MQIAIPVYERFTALDAIGPYEVLSRLPGAQVTFIAKQTGTIRTDTAMLGIEADATFDDLPHPEVIVVPGGHGTRALLGDEQILGWLRTAHETSEWTTSVCTGSLLLAAAGIISGLPATTHWGAAALLDELGAHYTEQRVVEQGKIITGAGVSAGIDMALTLAARIAGDDVAQAIQLGIEYDPQPPFDAGSPSKAPASVKKLAELAEAAEAAATSA